MSGSTESGDGRGRVLLLGAYGYLGTILQPALERAGFVVISQGRSQDARVSLDPTDAGALEEAIARERPGFIINLVAATNVDECEADPALAERINVGVVRNIGSAIRGSGTHFVQISTDQVYNGTGPHAEDDADPVNVYARTKLRGEYEAESVGALVLRVNIVGPSLNPNRVSFTDWLLGQLRSRQPLTLFSDVLFSPLEARDLAGLIARTVGSKLSGTFNLGSRDGISKAGFGIRLADEMGIADPVISEGKVADSNLKAPRPTDMRMDCTRFENVTGIQLPSIDETIRRSARRHVELGVRA